MADYEVPEPILNSPYDEPKLFWDIEEGRPPIQTNGRRPAFYFYRDPRSPVSEDQSDARGTKVDLPLVNQIRKTIAEWRTLALRGEGGVTRTTMELLNYWRREGRTQPLFFAQLEAAETIILLTEARADFLQGIRIPLDEPSEDRKTAGYTAFKRYACKMATGTGKTTVMGMLAAWSILNKVGNRGDARFSDVVLIVCPNVTIRSRLGELDPNQSEASLYRTRDLVPPHLMPDLTKGRVLVTNWHVFEPQGVQVGGVGAKVVRAGEAARARQKITIGPKTTTARGYRYMTAEELQRQTNAGLISVLEEERDGQGHLTKVYVETTDYVESDTALVNRVLGREIGGKQNVLVFNDEAHHAYRIRQDENESEEEDEDESDEFFKEATVWVEGLDKINKLRKINFCVDLSATPYFLGRVGQETNKVFPWVVSEFGLTDAIESGLVKIPQLAVRDTTGAEIPGYFNIWRWIMTKLTGAERGGKRGSAKPEAVLKWAHSPVAMLGGLWDDLRKEWEADKEGPRTPVFIIVCKNTKIAKVLFDWLAEDKPPTGIPSANLPGFVNRDGQINTIRVDSKVVNETDTGQAKSNEFRWMRLTLDTVGRSEWPLDRQGNPIYPEGFEELAKTLRKPLSPPGRDVRCIVSVGMLTEGWDCRTVTHIVGLRPFMSQLLCEQVVGRGLRRASYDVGPNGKLSEEVAKVFGVPFEIIPFKKSAAGGEAPPQRRFHIHAVPEKKEFRIQFPRVEGYRQAIRNRVTVDWTTVPTLRLDPTSIPPEVQVKAALSSNRGRPSLLGPGKLEKVDLNPYRSGRRFQELVFDLAADLARDCVARSENTTPTQVLFPQVVKIVERYLKEKVEPMTPANILDVFLSPYYGWVIENLSQALRPDVGMGETPELPRYEASRGPGSTDDVDYHTSRPVREAIRCHLNYVVADTQVWEQSAAYFIDNHEKVDAFVKNAGLGFAVPYLRDGKSHDYIPDFIIRLRGNGDRHLILETKGYDELKEIKAQAADRWVKAVNADGRYGKWSYKMIGSPYKVNEAIDTAAAGL